MGRGKGGQPSAQEKHTGENSHAEPGAEKYLDVAIPWAISDFPRGQDADSQGGTYAQGRGQRVHTPRAMGRRFDVQYCVASHEKPIPRPIAAAGKKQAAQGSYDDAGDGPHDENGC